MQHKLKIIPKYFNDVKSLRKTFEVRKDDRDFRINDTILLREWSDGDYTGRSCVVKITYILGRLEEEKQFVAEGLVILSISFNRST